MTSIFVDISASWSSPPSAPVLGSPDLDTLDARLMNAVYRVGHVWTTHAVNTGGRASSRYYELDPVTGTEVQLGDVTDDVGGSLFFFNPSIAVSSEGHAVLGCTGCDASQYAGAYYTGRLASDPPGEMAYPFEYQPGLDAYNLQSGTQRWGDYSLTSADPVDDTVWTMQEFAHSGNRWGNYIAQLDFPPDCGAGNYCTISPNSAGAGAQMAYAGSFSIAANDLSLVSYGCPPNQFGLFYTGPDQASTPMGDGVLCVGGSLTRFPAFQVDWMGIAEMAIDYNNLPGGLTIQAGDQWRYSFWFRDPGFGSAGYNFANGLEITFCP